jgi:N-acetylmuramoyl-L-alanine amidase
VFVDLPQAGIDGQIAQDLPAISTPLLKRLSVARTPDSSARLVLELDGAPRYSTFPLYDPFRLVVDVETETATSSTRRTAPAATALRRPVDRPAENRSAAIRPVDRARTESAPAGEAPPVQSAAASAPATPSSTSAGSYSLARQLGLGVAKIVIDPGHGGHDPGASANGVTEAAVVLDIALKLEALLRAQPGFDVVLTRRTDTFVPLEERTAAANREAADLFVSIHANASRRTAARGVETFFLDFATTPYAEEVAARENASAEQTMKVLPELVRTIAMHNKLAESQELATTVQAALVRRLRPLSRNIKDLGVKKAPFVVLIGAEMPSVLAEVSFVTNKTDAALLRQASHRQRIAQALCDAIVKYQSSLKKVSTVASHD